MLHVPATEQAFTARRPDWVLPPEPSGVFSEASRPRSSQYATVAVKDMSMSTSQQTSIDLPSPETVVGSHHCFTQAFFSVSHSHWLLPPLPQVESQSASVVQTPACPLTITCVAPEHSSVPGVQTPVAWQSASAVHEWLLLAEHFPETTTQGPVELPRSEEHTSEL